MRLFVHNFSSIYFVLNCRSFLFSFSIVLSVFLPLPYTYYFRSLSVNNHSHYIFRMNDNFYTFLFCFVLFCTFFMSKLIMCVKFVVHLCYFLFFLSALIARISYRMFTFSLSLSVCFHLMVF